MFFETGYTGLSKGFDSIIMSKQNLLITIENYLPLMGGEGLLGMIPGSINAERKNDDKLIAKR